ncbi:MAG: hypothetical protein IPL23_30955 [Saprospiraceae bacterium]|nr:hypothetical protein [Saprospiraceae bacterium]
MKIRCQQLHRLDHFSTDHGFYFEKFPTTPNYITKNICVLIVNSGTLFWLKALFVGKFKSYPAIKLYGQLGERWQRLNKRLRRGFRWLKGNDYLWGTMDVVRDITFTNAEIINLGKMTKGL